MNFFYEDCLPKDVDVKTAEKLVALADKYDVPKLKHLAETILLPKVTAETALFYICFGDSNNSTDVKSTAIRVLLVNFPAIAKTDEWREFARDKPVLLADIMAALAQGYTISVTFGNTTC